MSRPTKRLLAAITAGVFAVAASVVAIVTPAAAQTLDERLDRIAASTTGEAYVPLAPARVFESRPGELTVDGQFAGVGRLTAGQQVRVTVAGRAGVPSDAAGVMINPTAVFADGPGFLNIHPCADPAPLASSVNFFGGDVVGNELFVGLDAGDLCAFTSIGTDLTIDVVGYAPAGSQINPLVPARLVDTRDGELTVDGRFAGGGPVAAGSTTRVEIVGRGGVPAGADAVMLNIVAVLPSAPGFFAVHACDGIPAATSSLNYLPGDIEPNEIIADVNATGEICVDSLASSHLLVDVVGWIDAGSNLQQPTAARLADTREGESTVDGQFAGDGRLAGGSTYEVRVAGRGGITTEARAGIVNVAVVEAGAPGFVTVHGCLDQTPLASSINYLTGDTLSRELVVELDDEGDLCVFTLADIDLVIDGVGQFTKIPPAPTDADLSVTIADSPDPASAGDTVTFTIDVANAGPATASNVRVTTALPAGFTFVSTSGCSEDPNGAPSCSLGELTSGGTDQFTVMATVDAGTTGDQETRAVVNSDSPDPDASDNSATTTTSVNSPPVQAPELTAPGPFSSIGNVGISVPAASGLLDAATITDADSTGPFTIKTPFPISSANGGTVSISADGSFTYTPSPGFEGDDTFDYAVCDNETTPACSADETVTITVADMIWFVDDSAAAGGDGTVATPFDAATDFNSAATEADDDLFLFSGTYTSGFDLPDGTVVVGQGATGASLAALLGITVPPHSQALPAIGGTDPVLTSTTDDALQLGSGNTVRGLDIGNTPGHHALAGTSVGTLVVSEVGVTGTGGIIEVTTGGDLSGVSFTTQQSTTSPGGAAISLTGLSGGGTYNAGSPTITSSTGDGINITNTSQPVTFTTITVTNSVTDGVEIVNPAAPVTLGTVNVDNSTSNGRALVVNGGTATVSATAGTLRGGQSSAIEVDNATLSGGVTSATSINGVEPGIDIVNSTGSFTISGDGGTSANGSGGTISNKTGNAIVLSNAAGITLEQLTVSTIGDNGLRGTATNGLTVTGSTFTSTGNQAGGVEAGIFLTNPVGAVTLTGLTLDASFEDHLRIDNAGVAGTITVENSTFRNGANSASSNDAFRYSGTGSSDATIVIANNTFQDSRGDHVQVLVEGAAGADVTIGGPLPADGNTMTANASNPNIAQSGINVAAGASYSGRLDYSIANNNVQGAEQSAISTNLGGGSLAGGTVVGSISGNTIGTSGSAGSAGFGVRVIANGAGTHTASITNNTVNEQLGDHALLVEGRDGSGTLNSTITANTFVNTTNTTGFAIMSIYAGAISTDTFTVCADITANDLAGQAPVAGIADFDIFEGSGTNTLNLPGYAGTPDGATVEAFLQGQNVGSPTADALVTGAGQITGTGTSCP